MANPSQLTQLRSLIMDMDGVVRRGHVPIPGASEFLGFLRQWGISFLLLTNNSTLTSKQYAVGLQEIGIEAGEDSILTAGEATAMYLAQVAKPGARVYVVGEEGLRTELLKRSFVLDDGPDVAFVVVGLDRQFTYDKMTVATQAILRGARFIGTNPDKTFPAPTGLVPGAGAVLAGIEAATGMAPLIIGKPQHAIFELALQKLEADTATTAMLGDRLETDIYGGSQMGLLTILVLSGVTDAEQLANSAIHPDLVYQDVAILHRAWKDVLTRHGAS